MVQINGPEKLPDLLVVWLKGIEAFPWTYLRQRKQLAYVYLAGYWGSHPGIDENRSISLFFPAANERINEMIKATPPFLFSHGLCVVGSILLACVAFWLGGAYRLLSAFQLVGVAYQLEFLFVAVVPDFRYGYAGAVIFYAGAGAMLAAVLASCTSGVPLRPPVAQDSTLADPAAMRELAAREKFEPMLRMIEDCF